MTEREQGAITQERMGILQDKHEQEKVKFNSTKHNKEAFRNLKMSPVQKGEWRQGL